MRNTISITSYVNLILLKMNVCGIGRSEEYIEIKPDYNETNENIDT
jgi:hypothetical protein